MSARPFTRALLAVLAGVSTSIWAQSDNRTIQLLLKDVPGAPTPDQVVEYCNTWPHAPVPPLQSFSVYDPKGGDFLLPERASGDFLAWLQANPHSVRKMLEGSMLITFDPEDIPEALAALQADPFVAVAEAAPATDFHAAQTRANLVSAAQPNGGGQYGWEAMHLDAAWQLTGGGYALITQIDSGLQVNGPAFRQFSDSGGYLGGNYIPVASKDVGLTGRPVQPGFDPSDVDEAKAMFIPASPCTSVDAFLPPARLGHGTHVAGLLGANVASGLGVKGTCKYCGIAAYRTAFLLGFSNSPFYDCGPYRNQPNCLTIAYAVSRDAAMIASSGNDRTELNFPASDRRVISAGGFQSDGQDLFAFWDESPGGSANCPLYPLGLECGSDFSKWYGGSLDYRTHQETLGSAQHVLSTTYPGTDYRNDLECGDSYGTPLGDGIGWCTGTSMSAPQIAGLVGLLRSVNPLVPVGVPEPPAGTAAGLRTVLSQTATQAQAAQPWSPSLGYGIPDAAAAARRVLGNVAGGGVRNRATPLFRLRNAYAKDFAETTSPQYAMSLMITQVHNYVQPVAGLGAQPVVPGYAFPYDPDDPAIDDDHDPYESPPPAPLAAIYVLTTDVNPRAEWPALVPLHLMDKPKATGRDYLLATTTADIEAAHSDGFNLRTIQGYVFATCEPEPSCIPQAAESLYRACKPIDNDCATFLESERTSFEAAGYTSAYPAGSNKKLGYAYPATNSDGDLLPDGFELVIGTSPNRADSDADGISDSAEFPLAGVPVSDPCTGGVGALYCPANTIFKNGFEDFQGNP